MIDDNRGGGEPAPGSGDHFLDDRVVLEHQMDAFRATHRFGGRAGRLDAELRQLAHLVRGAVPRGDGVAAFGRTLGECAAEKTGAEKCNVCHVRS